jgi:hypothetical protein
MYSAFASFFLNKPHISLEDTFNMEQIHIYKPFTKKILTANYDHPLKGKKIIRYSGYHELAYLHPKKFNPKNSIINDLGLKQNEKYCIIRFVSWQASHDKNHSGISDDNKSFLVNELSKYLKVFISSEKQLPNDLIKYKYPLKPETMHDAIAYSSLVFGESATMVAEGAVLGVPGVYLDNTGRLYTKEMEEKFGLVYNFTESKEDQKKAIKKAVEILTSEKDWKKKHQKMLSEKINVTSFLVWFIERYPESIRILKENPDYQYKFK